MCESVLNESHRKKNEIVKITASPADLGSKFPFKPGSKVKITRFVGYEGNDEQYEVEKGGKKAILPDTMFESVELNEDIQEVNESSELKLKSKELNSELRNIVGSLETINEMLEEDEDFRFEVMKLDEWKKVLESFGEASKFTLGYAGKNLSSAASKLDKTLKKNIK